MFNGTYISIVKNVDEQGYYQAVGRFKENQTSDYILNNYKPIVPLLNEHSKIAPLQRWYTYLIDLESIWIIKDLEVSVYYHRYDHFPESIANLEIHSKDKNNLNIQIRIHRLGPLSPEENKIIYSDDIYKKQQILAPRIDAAADKLQKTFVDDLVNVWKKYRGVS